MRTTLTPTLINAAIRVASAGGKGCELNDPIEPGLNLRIGKHRATWTWLGRDSYGRVRRFGLGRYPHVGLAEARRRVRAMADDVRRGADPVAEARARRAARAAPKGHTLDQLLDLYGRQVGAGIKSWRLMLAHIRRVFRPHLHTALASLGVGALQMTVDQHLKPKSASFGVRCLLPVLRWAAAPGRGYVDRSLLDLRAPVGRITRDRVLTRDELRALLPVLRERAPDDVYAAALRFILLTAARRNEVTLARWQDVDFAARTWTLPETKNGQSHIVPLSCQACALLRELAQGEPDSAALVFSTQGRSLARWEQGTRRLQEASKTTTWTRHDLRRTAATLMGELGILPDIIEAALNHTTIHSQIASVYNKARYRPQVAEALQRLADALDGVEQGGAEVIALPAR